MTTPHQEPSGPAGTPPQTTPAQVALVTGSNRGIGFETCRQLAGAGIRTILTSRKATEGEQAADLLKAEGLDVVHHPLDVTDLKSIEGLIGYLSEGVGRIDILVNNAAIYLDEGESIFRIGTETMRMTMETNFYGPFHLCRALVPLMRRHAYGRIVNVSSGYGSLSGMKGKTAAYKISKAALNALTRIVADEVKGYNIKVNAVSPGWVRTDMGGAHAPDSPEKAAAGIVWLATLPKDGPTGGFFEHRKPVPW